MNNKIGFLIGFFIISVLAITLSTSVTAETMKDIQEIKERVIRVETKVEEGQRSITQKK